MERIPSAQPPPCLQPKHPLDIADMQGMEYPMYVYKPRRGVKRGDDKETYKLPHRLIEKKRRDRINECIAQLKDLLPEHLKLTTLGHLEKAVVLELTLKHVKALSSLLDQQQQKIVALQSGAMICEQEDDGAESEEMFRSGFHLCAKEVLRYLADRESGGDLTPSHVMGHIHKVASEVLHHPAAVPRPPDSPAARGPSAGEPEKGHAMNCVPVIQRTSRHGAGEQSGSDTDTDSGYGGEHEKTQRAADCCGGEGEPKQAAASPVKATGAIKREGDEPEAKRPRSGSPEEADRLSAPSAGAPGSFVSFSPNQPPFCMPFYLIPSAAAAAAAYLPMLEKCWYSGGMPVMYPPGMGAHAAGYPSDALPSSLAMASRAASPGQHHHQNLVESPALLQALKQIPPLNMETKD